MLEEVVVILRAEERLDPIWTVDCSYGNVPCGIPIKVVLYPKFPIFAIFKKYIKQVVTPIIISSACF